MGEVPAPRQLSRSLPLSLNPPAVRPPPPRFPPLPLVLAGANKGRGQNSRVGVPRRQPELGGGASTRATPPPQTIWSIPPAHTQLPGIPLSHFRGCSCNHGENNKRHSIH